MSGKRTSIADRLKGRRQVITEPSAPSAPQAEEKPGLQRSRQGKVNMALWVDPALRDHLHFVARKRGMNLQTLVLHYIEKGLLNDGETPR